MLDGNESGLPTDTYRTMKHMETMKRFLMVFMPFMVPHFFQALTRHLLTVTC